MGRPVVISFQGDSRDLTNAAGDVSKAVNRAADDAVKAGRRIDSSFDSTAGHADNVASKGSQAAGALSGLGGLAATQGGALGGLGAQAVVAGTAVQGLADAGDLLNVVTESTIAKTLLSKAATVGSTAATVAGTVATKLAAGGQWLLNAALSANPIGLVVLGLVAATAGIVLLYKKSATARKIINGAFGAIKAGAKPVVDLFTKGIPHAISGVVNFVKSHWKPIISIMLGPLGLIVAGVSGHVQDIKDKFNDVVGFVRGIPGRFRDLISNFTNAGGDLIGGLVKGLSNPVGAVGPVAESIVNGIIGFLNDHLPHSLSINKGPIHVSVPLFPTIPQLAGGGITTGPMLALIGDNPGGREAVIPLDKFDLTGRSRALTIGNLNLVIPHGASNYDVGEYLVEKLRAYFDGGGTL